MEEYNFILDHIGGWVALKKCLTLIWPLRFRFSQGGIIILEFSIYLVFLFILAKHKNVVKVVIDRVLPPVVGYEVFLLSSLKLTGSLIW